MEVDERQRALAFLHAGITEDLATTEYLQSEPVSINTFYELVTIAAAGLEFVCGREEALKLVETWMLLSLQET